MPRKDGAGGQAGMHDGGAWARVATAERDSGRRPYLFSALTENRRRYAVGVVRSARRKCSRSVAAV